MIPILVISHIVQPDRITEAEVIEIILLTMEQNAIEYEEIYN